MNEKKIFNMTRWEDWNREHGTLPSPATDYSEWPSGYSILLNEKIMHPEDLSLWKMKLDQKRQLFVDDYLIAHTANVRRQFHSVKKHPANPVFKDVWPQYFSAEGNLLRMYTKDMVQGRRCVRLFQSEDGVHWRAPNLDVCDVSDYPPSESIGTNNVVCPRGQLHGLFCEPDAPDPERQWKMILSHHKRSVPVTWPYLKRQDGYYKDGSHVPLAGAYVRKEKMPEQVSFYELHTSRDGINWKFDANTSLQKSESHVYTPLHRPLGIGDCLVTRWDPILRKYIAHAKAFVGPDFRFPPCNEARTVLWCESDDLIHWSPPRVYAYPDTKDAATYGMYGVYEADGWPYESMWLGCLSMTAYFPSPNTDWLAKLNWIVLAGSRDGHTWYYLGDREPFIPNGEGNSFDAHYIRMANLCNTGGPLVRDNELWFYYLGNYGGTTEFAGLERGSRARWEYGGGIGKIRRDGFASLNAGDRAGVVITRPLTFLGEGVLWVNADVESGGYVKVSVLSEDAAEVPMFEEHNCNGVSMDTLCGVIRWKEREMLAEVKNRYIRLAFHLKNAKLYSFWIS